MAAIAHVVVLMFENRSFDHLLGLLSDDPAYPGVRPGDERFGNPLDPYDPASARVLVTDDATADLAFDPPHSHGSVVEQTGLRRPGGPTMDGFVAAYSRKLHGNEDGLPVVHWGRIAALAGAVVVGTATVFALPWPAVAIGVALLAALVLAAVHWLRRRGLALPVRDWRPLYVFPVGVAVAGAALSAALSVWLPYGWRVLVVAVVLAAAGAFVVLRLRRRLRTPLPVTPDQAGHIMRCMRPTELPALARLADGFAVCTRWHCSVPGATWPNRNFAHAGTSDGTVDIEVGFYDNDTIFHRLSEAGRSWRIYRDRRSLAQVMAFDWLTDEERIGNWRLTEDLAADVAAGDLAEYTFIEPCHDGNESDSQHPGNNAYDRQPGDFARGDALVARVYEALRANPALFASTLLVVTYDEHGGFYDHVPPPTDAVAPAPFGAPRRSWLPVVVGWFVEQPESRFRFTAYGPRVPTVVVSPLIPAGTWDDTPYDHTAIPRTVRELFAPGTAPLSGREAVSPTFARLASLAAGRTDLPDLSALTQPPPPAAPAEAAVPPPPAAASADVPHQAAAPEEPAPPAPPVWPAPPAPPATTAPPVMTATVAERDDEFARQLRELGAKVAAKLGPDPTERAATDVADLFTRRAERARARPGR